MGAARSILKTRPVVKKPAARIERNEPSIDSKDLEVTNEELVERLKSVYVETKSTLNVDPQLATQTIPQEHVPSYHDPLDMSHPAEGYLTIQDTMNILDKHRLNPDIWDCNKIAQLCKIDVGDAQNLLKYFGNFYVNEKVLKDKPELKFHPLHR